jgi:hypothetical protein
LSRSLAATLKDQPVEAGPASSGLSRQCFFPPNFIPLEVLRRLLQTTTTDCKNGSTIRLPASIFNPNFIPLLCSTEMSQKTFLRIEDCSPTVHLSGSQKLERIENRTALHRHQRASIQCVAVPGINIQEQGHQCTTDT